MSSSDTETNAEADIEARRILDRYVVDGRIVQMPRQGAKRRVVLDWLVQEFEPGVRYSEKQVNLIVGLHHADMAVDSLYNTYRFPGLPPGPIGNPGRSALEAALHPETTKFLYFVSDGNGHHRFATTLEEHNRNVAAYRRALGMR